MARTSGPTGAGVNGVDGVGGPRVSLRSPQSPVPGCVCIVTRSAPHG